MSAAAYCEDGSFELPEGSEIEGYYTDDDDGLRYPFGRCTDGYWVCDRFGWAMWPGRARRDAAMGGLE